MAEDKGKGSKGRDVDGHWRARHGKLHQASAAGE